MLGVMLLDIVYDLFQQSKAFYRNYKKFDENSFLHDLQNKNFSLFSNDPKVNYKSITEHFFGSI